MTDNTMNSPTISTAGATGTSKHAAPREIEIAETDATQMKGRVTTGTDRRAMIDAFNAGALDAMAFKGAGATGGSDRPSGKHEKPREMVVLEAPSHVDIWAAGEKLDAPDADTGVWGSGKTLDTPDPGYLFKYDLWELEKATDAGHSEPPIMGESLRQIQQVISKMATVDLDGLSSGIADKVATLQGIVDSAKRDLRDQFSRGDRSEEFAAAGVIDRDDPHIVQKCLPSITFAGEVGMRNCRSMLDAIEERAKQLTNEEDGPAGPGR
jgi:hypothetical protein